jgi:hypothetical protein
MNRVLVQPAGNRLARAHIQHTVQGGMPLARLRPSLPPAEANRLAQSHGERLIPVWGMVPNRFSERAWHDLMPGDVALFVGDNRLFASGVVVGKLREARLAEALWDVDEQGRPWALIYLLDEVQWHDIPRLVLNQVVGRPDSYIWRPVQLLSPEHSSKVLAAFGLWPQAHHESVSEADYLAVVQQTPFDSEAALDIPALTKRRLEQGFLRQVLLHGAATGRCALCGRMLPAELLVAAHLKRRSACTQQERADWRHIALLMCKLGCDDLYERGYLTIDQGKVRGCPTTQLPPALQELIEVLDGRPVAGWMPGHAPYCDWHRTLRFRGSAE